MKHLCAVLAVHLLLAAPASTEAAPVLRVVRSSLAGNSLLRNGSFEESKEGEGKAIAWTTAPKGCQRVLGEGRNGSAALRCDNPSGEGWFGASQTLTLNRTNTAPLMLRGWSKARGVSGSSDSGYSFYVDIVYADGTPLWGQTANLRCGTHDWQHHELLLLHEQPIRSLTVHCLFRGHAGTVWFDDVTLEETSAPGGTVLFQGAAVHDGGMSPLGHGVNRTSHKSGDELELHLSGNLISSLQYNDRNIAAASAHAFLLRDVATNSDFFGLEDGSCPQLDLDLSYRVTTASNHLAVHGRLTDKSGRDRAVTLLFVLPVDALGWRWGTDIRRNRLIEGRGDYINQVRIGAGATGTLSQYPVAAIWDANPSPLGLALGLDMTHPAVFRLGYHAGLKVLSLAMDFGLVKDSVRFPGSADFRFVLYGFDGKHGFRAAWQKYMEIFPEHFVVRAHQQGLWMPFTDVSKVAGWEDFGFRFHEGNNNVPWDDAHGILSFRYTEPMTWWMPMPKELKRTPADAARVLDEMSRGNNEAHRRMAEVSRLAAMFDEDGQPSLLFRNEPWCNGAVWSLNPNPHLGAPLAGSRFGSPPSAPLNAATVHWDQTTREKLYGASARGRLDGEYLDSLEGYVTAELNFRRDHFRDTSVPLTFSLDTRRPALFKGLAVFEFTKWLAEDVHRLGKLTFANGVPYRFSFLCPWLDVLGTETDWLRGKKYQPASMAQMDLWRTMSGGKPYLLLMNTDYDAFTPDLVEKYFQRCLFYGMWPGFFSHNAADNPYFQNPRRYNRDRHLFRRYIPILKRVAEAGWQPVCQIKCDNETVQVEQFGPGADGEVYFTAFNPSALSQTASLVVADASGPGHPRVSAASELVSGRPLESGNRGWKLQLGPDQTAVVQFR